jgi:hypothetical protein
MLGSLETIGSFGDLFAVVDHKNRIYSKKITAYRQYPVFRPDELSMTTPAAARLLNLLSTDVGRPISNINLSVQIPDLGDLVSGVVETVRTQEREVSDRSGRRYLLRTHPYRTADNRIDGAVLVVHDGVETAEPPARPVQPD